MTWQDIDRPPRLRDLHAPEELNDDSCIALAGVLLQGLAAEYIHAKRAALLAPDDKGVRKQLEYLTGVYRSEWFAALSGGLADGEGVMRMLDEQIDRTLPRRNRRRPG